jgi:hypothetical protein
MVAIHRPKNLTGQTRKQLPIARKQFLQGVQKKTIAKAPGAAQKVILTLVGHLHGKAAFVDLVITLFNDFRKSLNANGQLETMQQGVGHGRILGRGHRRRQILALQQAYATRSDFVRTKLWLFGTWAASN